MPNVTVNIYETATGYHADSANTDTFGLFTLSGLKAKDYYIEVVIPQGGGAAMQFALVDQGAGAAAWTAVGFLVANILFGTVLEPRLMGRGLGLSTLVVFLSLVFWGWVLGPVGMFLSVPLTMTVRIALESREDTRWIAVLLGPGIDPATDGAAQKAQTKRQTAIWKF